MKLKFKILTLSTLSVLISVLVIFTVVKAGSLTPPSGATVDNVPVTTMHSIDDIYQKIPSTTLIWQTTGTCSITTATTCNVNADCPAGQTCNPALLSLCFNAGASVGCSVGEGLIQPNSTPLGAVEYCNYLGADGLTIAATPQNIWRLPNIEELLQGLNNQFQMIPSVGSGFVKRNTYSSSTIAVGYSGYMYSGIAVNHVVLVSMDNEYNNDLARCVHN